MNTLFAAARSVHYASTLLLFGELVFLLAVAGAASGGDSTGSDAVARRFLRVARWSIVVSVASGVAWFVVAAAVMSGLPVAEILDRRTLSQVLAETEFGRAWMLRVGLAVVIGLLLVALARAERHLARLWIALGMLAIAAPYVATLAWAGHAAAGEGADGDIEIVADVVHLVAAGAWLGALPGFVFLLRRMGTAADTVTEQLAATRRFGTLGVVCVALLAASGTANAWYLVGDVPALIGTSYGRLLCVKLALFAAMLALAIANRWYLAVRLAERDGEAPRLIRRNAIAEIVAGVGVVVIVGVLGVTPPAIHEVSIWPFAHTVSFARAEQSAWLQLALAAAGLMACVAVGVVFSGLRRRRPREWLVGAAGIVVLAAIFVPMLAVPAYPSTYWSSPIRYTTDAIVAGSALYASNCRECHGLHRLDGASASGAPLSATMDPTAHALRHTDGEHYWWIAHGLPGTSMPGFASRLAEEDIWNLIEFLNAQVEAGEAMAMTDRIKPLRAIVAPDFTFESADRPQESLRQLRGKAAALLVLYTLPESMPRLSELNTDARAYAAAGARVIVAPFPSTSNAAMTLPDDVASAIATAAASVATAYALFAHQSVETARRPTHVEFLIDRDGYLRARWIGSGSGGAQRTSETLDRIAILRRETPLPPAPWGHRHR